MLDFLGDLRRTHMCGRLRSSDAGKKAVIMGWVNKRRDHGSLLFIDLRDRSGVTRGRVRSDHRTGSTGADAGQSDCHRRKRQTGGGRCDHAAALVSGAKVHLKMSCTATVQITPKSPLIPLFQRGNFLRCYSNPSFEKRGRGDLRTGTVQRISDTPR